MTWHQVNIRVSAEDYARLDALAERADLPNGTYARQLLSEALSKLLPEVPRRPAWTPKRFLDALPEADAPIAPEPVIAEPAPRPPPDKARHERVTELARAAAPAAISDVSRRAGKAAMYEMLAAAVANTPGATRVSNDP